MYLTIFIIMLGLRYTQYKCRQGWGKNKMNLIKMKYKNNLFLFYRACNSSQLQTRRLGRKLMYVPSCGGTPLLHATPHMMGSPADSLRQVARVAIRWIADRRHAGGLVVMANLCCQQVCPVQVGDAEHTGIEDLQVHLLQTNVMQSRLKSKHRKQQYLGHHVYSCS